MPQLAQADVHGGWDDANLPRAFRVRAFFFRGVHEQFGVVLVTKLFRRRVPLETQIGLTNGVCTLQVFISRFQGFKRLRKGVSRVHTHLTSVYPREARVTARGRANVKLT